MLNQAFPIVLWCVPLFREMPCFLSYFLNILLRFGVSSVERILWSILLQPLLGISYLSHYRDNYEVIQKTYQDILPLYGYDKISSLLSKIKTRMLTWKLFLFQASFIREQSPDLLKSKYGSVFDIDGTILQSFAKKKKGLISDLTGSIKESPVFNCPQVILAVFLLTVNCLPDSKIQKFFLKKH